VLWVLVFGGIALAGVVMVVCYGVWLAHKTADLWSELGMLGERAAELADLLAQIQPTPATYDDMGVALVASERRKT
jgi:hypothetical protein